MKNPRSKKTETQLQKEKGVTIQEFKAWLQGITAFQDADWSPNKDQWIKIKKKIDDLIDDHLSGSFKPTHPISSYQQPRGQHITGSDGIIELLPTNPDMYNEQPIPERRPAAPRTQTSLMVDNNITNIGARTMAVPTDVVIPSGLPAQKTPENQESYRNKFV